MPEMKQWAVVVFLRGKGDTTIFDAFQIDEFSELQALIPEPAAIEKIEIRYALPVPPLTIERSPQ